MIWQVVVVLSWLSVALFKVSMETILTLFNILAWFHQCTILCRRNSTANPFWYETHFSWSSYSNHRFYLFSSPYGSKMGCAHHVDFKKWIEWAMQSSSLEILPSNGLQFPMQSFLGNANFFFIVTSPGNFPKSLRTT